MPPPSYLLGQPVTLTSTYRDGSNALADPTSPTVLIIDSADTVQFTATPTRTSLGIYSYTFTLPASAPTGTWLAQWGGDIGGAGSFGVEAFEVEEVGAGLWIDPTTMTDEPRIQNLELPPNITVTNLVRGASDLLWAWSGRRYAVNTRTVRPVRVCDGCGCGWGNGYSGGGAFGGYGARVSLGYGWNCGCGTSTTIDLGYPVSRVVEVRVDGTVLSPSFYTLYDAHLLTRTDGLGWPCCQTLSYPSSSTPALPNSSTSYTVTYTRGTPPPYSGELACRELAVEIGQFLSGKPSRLPSRTRNVTRQGISIDISDINYLLDGKTGIPLVDMFLLSANPNRLTRAPSVTSPDTIHLASIPTN